MDKLIHGEVKFSNKCMGQLSDFMCILVSNGYSVEIDPKEDAQEVVVTIMTQIKEKQDEQRIDSEDSRHIWL